MATSIAIRLGVEGSAELKRVFSEVESTGKQAFGGISQAMEATGVASDRQMERYRKLAAAAREAEAAGKVQQNYASLLGIAPVQSGSARASASVFEDAFKGTENVAPRLKAIEAANTNVTKAIGLQGYEWRNLGLQANDAATMLLSGSSAFQVLATQGGQVLQVMQGANGGVGGALSSITSRAAALLSPVNVAGAALVGLGAGAAYAFSEYSAGQTQLEAAQQGLGRASGATVARMNDIALASAGAGRVSASSAREMIGAFAQTGKIGEESFGGLITASKDYARVTGMEIPDAAKELATALADPVKGFDLIAAKMGGLNGRTLQLIRSLDAQGDSTRAQKALLDAMAPTLDEAARKTSLLGDAWDLLKRKAAGAVDTVGASVSDLIRGPDASQRTIDNLNRQIEEARRGRKTPGFFGGTVQRSEIDAEIQRMETQRDAAIIMKDTADREARDRAREEAVNSASRSSVKIIDQYVPTMGDQLALQEFASTLEKAIDGGKGPAGAEIALKKIRDQLTAGGTEAFNLSKASRDAFDLSKLTGYGRELETINQKYRDQIALASASGNLAGVAGLVTARNNDLGALNASVSTQIDQTVRAGGSAFDIAKQFLGRQESSPGDPLGGFIASAGIKLSPQDQAWCAAFANAALIKSGQAGTGSNLASSFQNYGTATSDPRPGDIAVMRAQAAGASGHVGFFQGYDAAGRVRVLGGNQTVPGAAKGDNGVTEASFARDQVLSFRRVQNSEDVQAQVGMLDQWKRGTEQLTAANDLKNQSFSRSPFDIEKSRIALELETQAKARNEDVTEGLRKRIDDEATARARSTVTLQQSAADRSIQQGWNALGRTSDEQSVFGQASRYANEGTAEFDRLSGKFRDLQQMTYAKDLTGGAVKGLVSDLMRGTSAADAFASSLSRIGDSLANKAIDAALAPLFGGGAANSNGALLGSLFSSMGGSAIPKFDVGGYTGPGGRYDPAGIVHRGEYVFDQSAVGRIGVENLAALHRGGTGYADGGWVGRPRPIPSANLNMPLANVNTPAQVVINNFDGAPVTTRQEGGQTHVDIGRMVDGAVARGVASNRGPTSTAMKAAAGGRNLRG